MVPARGVSKDEPPEGCGSDRRGDDCIAENAEKIAVLGGVLSGRMAIGARAVLTIEEVRATHAASARIKSACGL
jgi:hypothetical protein